MAGKSAGSDGSEREHATPITPPARALRFLSVSLKTGDPFHNLLELLKNHSWSGLCLD
jgi:hypothetical protein